MPEWALPDGFDARLTPARADLAASALKDQITASRYTDGTPMQACLDGLSIRRAPASDAPQETQLLFGEMFTVLDRADGWAWGQAERDGYVGYVHEDGLTRAGPAPTHRVTALRAYRFSQPDLKSRPVGVLSMNATLSITDVQETNQGSYLRDQSNAWVWQGHTASIGADFGDPVEAAQHYLGAPYFWGGRESAGLDCSGLVQNAFHAAGMSLPRDADQQEAFFAHTPPHREVFGPQSQTLEETALQRGDLLFWPGHVAMMIDDQIMIHANATHMAVTCDAARPMINDWQARKNLALRRVIRPVIAISKA